MARAGKSCIILTLLMSFYGITSPGANARGQGETPAAFEGLKREIERIIDEHNVPGATITLVSKDGVIWTCETGKSDVAAGTTVTTSTIFRWGSVSKSFVSAAVLMLAERGAISLDDRIRDVAPEIEFNNRWESTHPVRVAHCLEHTTGFDDLHFNECAVNDPDISLVDALAINPKSRHARWKPGTYASYSNIGPVAAAHIVEKVTGMAFELFVRKYIFNSLDMHNASFHFPEPADLTAKGYGTDGLAEIPYDHIPYRPAGSLNSSSGELGNFVRMLLNRGAFEGNRILDSESIARMERPTTSRAARAGFALGYGLGNNTTMRDGYIFRGHDGMITGFTASYGYNVALGRGYAFSINTVSDGALDNIKEAICAYFTAGRGDPELQPASVPADDLAPLTGYYQSITPMSQLLHTLLLRFVNIRKVSLEKGALSSRNFLLGKNRRLIPLSNTSFYRKHSRECLAFIKDGDETVISFDSLRGNFKKISKIRAFSRFAVFVLVLLLMISPLAYAVIWIPRNAIGRLKDDAHLFLRIFPLLATILFCITYTCLFIGILNMELDKTMMMKLGSFTGYSLMIFISSVLFALFSFLGLLLSLRALVRRTNKALTVYRLMVSAAQVGATIYLWHGKVIGIMTWSF